MNQKPTKLGGTPAPSRTWKSAAIAVCLAAVAVAVGWSFLMRPAPTAVKGEAPSGDGTRSGMAAEPQANLFESQPAVSETAPALATPPPAKASAYPPATQPAMLMSGSSLTPTRRRSPLESSPGYTPPNDPESLSVITGRREGAPLVDLQFAGGGSSIDDLARRLVAAVDAGDDRALFNLRVTRKEFEVILWPEFPESRPITNITADDAWVMGIEQNLAGVNRTIGSYGGHDLELLKVDTDPPQEFRNFRLYRGVQILVRERGTGKEVSLHFAPSFAERLGRFKVLTYRDRE